MKFDGILFLVWNRLEQSYPAIVPTVCGGDMGTFRFFVAVALEAVLDMLDEHDRSRQGISRNDLPYFNI